MKDARDPVTKPQQKYQCKTASQRARAPRSFAPGEQPPVRPHAGESAFSSCFSRLGLARPLAPCSRSIRASGRCAATGTWLAGLVESGERAALPCAHRRSLFFFFYRPPSVCSVILPQSNLLLLVLLSIKHAGALTRGGEIVKAMMYKNKEL